MARGPAAPAPAAPSTARALLLSCHPVPTAAVTALTTSLGAAVGLAAADLALLAAAVLTGQLSVGWSNDLLDRRRDATTARADKPLAAAGAPVRAAAVATALALAAALPPSLALGAAAGAAHLGFVASAWAYNLGLKAGPLSWLPYATGFGLLPAVPVLAAGAAPPAWLCAAGALLGVGAHLFNALPDVEDDEGTGVRGLPVRLGRAAGRLLGCLLLVAAVAVLALLPPGPAGPAGWAALAAGGGLAVAAALDGGARGSRRGFVLAVGTAAVGVALLAARTASLG
ncbi:UbiA family prenyltransferase [Vallicoccus soli]|uniref:Ubiquinone biosynthesis protein UbiA n=1 Tax=Vallicoccus soli TaxID=2339232 RepID=A0A3A3Z0F9_9ACTN|nr:UbiA family prenyltransferase [Vallicoccus soli]RJK97740.1 hypothetical protein D5H78_01705 [Vallicoccus soli]